MRLPRVCFFVVCRHVCALWRWWWCRGVAGTAAEWSRDKTVLNCNSVHACALLPCLWVWRQRAEGERVGAWVKAASV